MLPAANGRHRKHRFIVIEGVDGVGKTTISEDLAEKLGGTYFRTPTPSLEEFKRPSSTGYAITIRQYVDQFAHNSPRTRFAFYLFCIIEATNQIENFLETSDVVCDRFIASTLAYHRVLDPELASVNVDWAVVLQPDLQILLELKDKDEHARRLRSRMPCSDKFLEENIEFLEAVKREFRKLGLYEIDTTGKPKEMITNEIVEYLCDEERVKK
jgi:dTMP kinase